MPAPVYCAECRAILEEMKLALAGAPPSSERRAEVQANVEAFSQMLQGSEQAAEELFGKLSLRANSPELLEIPRLHTPRMRRAFRRMLDHRTRTGHIAFF
jgi:hypothetical protein